MSAPRKDILVVIPCLNEERTISSVLDRLMVDSCAARTLVVVADGGSKDFSRAIVHDYVRRFPTQIALVENRQKFQSAGVNLAVACHGEGFEWMIRLDAHAEYPPDYLHRLIETAKRKQADTVVVPMRSSGTTCFQRGVAAAQNSIFGTGGSPHRHPGHSDWVDHGHHALFRMSAFKKVDGYDATFSHNEDAELDFRLSASGARIWLDGDLAIQYWPRSTFRSLLTQYLAYGKGRARTAKLHGIKLRLRQKLPLLVAPALLMGLLAPLTPWAAAPMALWLAGCLAAGPILGVRDRSACVLVSAPAALVAMHAGWSFGFWGQQLFGAAKRSTKVSASPQSAERGSFLSGALTHRSTHPERP